VLHWDYVPNVAWSDVGDQEVNFLSFVNVLGSVAVNEDAGDGNPAISQADKKRNKRGYKTAP
jgi:hypothetical protein